MRLAEAVGVLALATDLGNGYSSEHALRACLLSVTLGERTGLDEHDLADLYYLTLLRLLGCTADSEESAEYFFDEVAFARNTMHLDYGDPVEFGRWVTESFAAEQPPQIRRQMLAKMFSYTPERRRAYLAGHCEVAQMLARRLGLAEAVIAGLALVFERWDGDGAPNRVRGEATPAIVRVMTLANDLEIHHRIGGRDAALAMAKRRSGGMFDPKLVEIFCAAPDGILAVLEVPSTWEALMAAEPGRPRLMRPDQVEAAGQVMGDFADLKSVHTIRHSASVADLVTAAASAARVPSGEQAPLRLAALGHDLGRVTVSNAIWDKPGPLAEAEWEQVRLHPYYSERLLGRPPALGSVAIIAGAHHERLDGSGYHRGSKGSALSLGARLLAVADSYQAMTQPRAHRPALAPEQAVREINSQVATGRLDPEAARLVLGAAGHQAPRVRRSWPEGLTEREVEVLRRVARGMSIAEAATDLHVAPKTVDFHLQNVYSKAGVSTRAAATLFAIEHGILEAAG